MELVKQQFVIKISDNRYYAEEVEIYSTDPPRRQKIIESTNDANEAARFDTFKLAMEISDKYNFKVAQINTYLEEVK